MSLFGMPSTDQVVRQPPSAFDPTRKQDGTVKKILIVNGRFPLNLTNSEQQIMTGRRCHPATGVAGRGWMRELVQEVLKDTAAPDDVSVVLGFTRMLSGEGNVEEVSRLATDHGWLDASGRLTAAGDQLAHALQQQNGTRTVFRVW
jgi:hypothetical protein